MPPDLLDSQFKALENRTAGRTPDCGFDRSRIPREIVETIVQKLGIDDPAAVDASTPVR